LVLEHIEIANNETYKHDPKLYLLEDTLLRLIELRKHLIGSRVEYSKITTTEITF
jgi:hypothetical protein